jgi:hypothetical protein
MTNPPAQKYVGNPESKMATFALEIQHVPTGHQVSFPAYLENLSDLYTQNWIAEDVYGRMDPIATFINTRRAISLAWNVPADSFEGAKKNLRKINSLMSFLYPLYSAGDHGATAINQAPLVRIKFGNLVCTPAGHSLLGYLNGFTFDPQVENGMFYTQGTNGAEYYPKTIRINAEMNVLHEHELGFVQGDANTFKFRNDKIRGGSSPTNFPYVVTPGPGRKTTPHFQGPIDWANSGFGTVANPNADVAANGPDNSAIPDGEGGFMPEGDEAIIKASNTGAE